MPELSSNRLSVDLLEELTGIPRIQMDQAYVEAPSSEMSSATSDSLPSTEVMEGGATAEERCTGSGEQLANGTQNPQVQALQQLLLTLPDADQRKFLNEMLAKVQQREQNGPREQNTGVEHKNTRLLPAAASGSTVRAGNPHRGRSAAASLVPRLLVAADAERSHPLLHDHADPIDTPRDPQPDIRHARQRLPLSASGKFQEEQAPCPSPSTPPRTESTQAGSTAAGQEAIHKGASQASANQIRLPGRNGDMLQEGWGELPATGMTVDDSWDNPLFNYPQESSEEWQAQSKAKGLDCILPEEYPSPYLKKDTHVQGRQGTQNPKEAKQTRARPQPSLQNGWQHDLQLSSELGPAEMRNTRQHNNKARSDEDGSYRNSKGNSEDGLEGMAHVRPAELPPQRLPFQSRQQVDEFAAGAGCAPNPFSPHAPIVPPLPVQIRPIPLPAAVRQALERLVQLDPGLDLDLEVLKELQSLSRNSENQALLALWYLKERDTARLNNPSAYLMTIIGNIRHGRTPSGASASRVSGGPPYRWPHHMSSWSKPPQSPRGRFQPKENITAEHPARPPPPPPKQIQQDSDSDETWENGEVSPIGWAPEFRPITVNHGRSSLGRRAVARVGNGISGNGAATEAGGRQMGLNPRSSTERNWSLGSSSSSNTSGGRARGSVQDGTILPAADHAASSRPIRMAEPDGLPLQQANGWSLGPSGVSKPQCAWIEPDQAAANDLHSPAAIPATGGTKHQAAKRKIRRAAGGRPKSPAAGKRSIGTAAGSQLPPRLSRRSWGHSGSGGSSSAGMNTGLGNGRTFPVSAQDAYNEDPIFAAKDDPDLFWRAEKKTPAPTEIKEEPATAVEAPKTSTTRAGFRTGSENSGLTAPANMPGVQPAAAAGRQIDRPMLSLEIPTEFGVPAGSGSLEIEEELSLDAILLGLDAIMGTQPRQRGPAAGAMILEVDNLYTTYPTAGPTIQGGPARSTLLPKYRPFQNATP